MHVSGGTLELLNVTIGNGIIGSITTLGGSLDITCGQLIDRIGVAAGLPFPSGAAMEKLYKPGAKKLAVHVQGLQANLSGAETQGLKRLAEGEDAPAVCSAVFDCVAETLGHLVRHVASARGLSRFIMTGGVMAGSVIREHMINTCESIGIECVLAQRQYCGDNACGLALAAERLHQKGVLR
jgi:N6-L-threonylcarbamoyladenine synthase